MRIHRLSMFLGLVLISCSINKPGQFLFSQTAFDSPHEVVASIAMNGEMIIGGDLYQNQTEIPAETNDFLVRNSAGDTVLMRIVRKASEVAGGPPLGALMLTGTVHEDETTVPKSDAVFLVKDDLGHVVAWLSQSGDLYLRETLTVMPVDNELVQPRVTVNGQQFNNGEVFFPKGFNYVNIEAGYDGTYTANGFFKQFDVDAYDPEYVESMLSMMEAKGYNIVRVFSDFLSHSDFWTCNLKNPPPSVPLIYGHLDPRVIENTADFFKRARRHKVYVYLTFSLLPPTYGNPGGYVVNTWNDRFVKNITSSSTPTFEVNLPYAETQGLYITQILDTILAAAHDPSLETTVAMIDIFNEPSYDTAVPPFSITTGTINLYRDGRPSPYDFHTTSSQRTEVAEMIERDWLATAAGKIEASYPHILKTTSLVNPADMGHAGYDDNVSLDGWYQSYPWRTTTVANTPFIDYLDVHLYAFECRPAYPIPPDPYHSYFQFGPATKHYPVMVGELGVFKNYIAGPCVDEAARPALMLRNQHIELTRQLFLGIQSIDLCSTTTIVQDCSKQFVQMPVAEAVQILENFTAGSRATGDYSGFVYWNWYMGDLPGYISCGSFVTTALDDASSASQATIYNEFIDF